MNKKSILLVLMCALFSTSAGASQELSNIIRCHEALDGKSEGRSTKLSAENATPFVILAGKSLYFVTNESVSVVSHKFHNQDVTFALSEKGQLLYRKVNFNKSGELAGISFEEPTAQDIKNAVSPSAQLDDESLNLLKKELLRRMNSVTAEYQNKYDPEGTIESLSVCRRVKSPELAKSLEKQVSFYEKLVRKKYSGKSSEQKKATGTK